MSPENAAFLKADAAANDPKLGNPNFMTAAGYDTMHVIYEVSKKLGGNIDVQSQVGQGTTVKIYMPRYTRGHADRAQAGQERERGSARGVPEELGDDASGDKEVRGSCYDAMRR